MSENLYTERFRQYSNGRLIEILENRSKYELPAIHAAEAELNSRNLSEEEINAERETLAIKEQKSGQLNKKVSSVSSAFNSRLSSVLQLINPVQREVPTNENLIKVASIAFTIFYVYPVIRDIKQFWFFLSGPGKVGLEDLLIVIPGIAPLIIIIPFFLKRKIGWILMTMYSAYILVSFVLAVYLEYVTFSRFSHSGTTLSWMQPQMNLLRYIFDILFFSGLLIFLFRRSIREIYDVTLQRAIMSVVTISLFTLVVFFKLTS